MPRQIILRPPSSNHRRQPLLPNQSTSGKGNSRFAEVAGGTTAECAAICCCCPCAIVNILVLAVYKLPAGLCRRALRKKRRQRLTKKGLLPPRRRRCSCGCDETEIQIHPAAEVVESLPENKAAKVEEEVPEKEVMDLEKEMWERFYSTGFWRSPSQRD